MPTRFVSLQGFIAGSCAISVPHTPVLVNPSKHFSLEGSLIVQKNWLLGSEVFRVDRLATRNGTPAHNTAQSPQSGDSLVPSVKVEFEG